VTARDAIEDVLPELCEQLRAPLRGLLYRYRIPPEDAEDVVQGALLLAVQKWDEIREPGAWLLGAVEKRCKLFWRARRKDAARYEQLEEWQPQLAEESAQEKRDLLADVHRVCRRELPAAQRKLLALRFQLGLSPREAASAMGLAHSSVRKTTNRAFGRLRLAVGTRPAPARDRKVAAVAPPANGWAARVKRRREQLRISQTVAAAQLGISRAYLAQVECGRAPSPALAAKLCHWLESEAPAAGRAAAGIG
jgi:RNA polymerase sigma factor (sigma-70 family)